MKKSYPDYDCLKKKGKKIIIVGAGDVGTHLAKMLSHENHDIVVIDLDEERLRTIDSSHDLLTVVGSATSFETLKEANVKKCNLFIAVTEKEEANIMASILAKKLGAQKVIARIDNGKIEILVLFIGHRKNIYNRI